MSKPFRFGVVYTHPTQHLSLLWRKLNEQPNVSVKVFYLSSAGQSGGDTVMGSSDPWDVNLLDGYDHEYLKTITGAVTGELKKTLFNPALFSRLNKESLDAVWISGFYTYSYRLAIVLCKLRGIPIISQCDSTIITDSYLNLVQKAVRALVYPKMLALSDYWLTSGDHNAIYLRHYGIPDSRLVKGNFPFDRERFEQTIERSPEEIKQIRKSLNLTDRDIVYGFAGKYIERKNPLDFVEAIAKANQQNPKIKGIMLGGGEMTARINQRISELGHCITNAGFINQSKLPLYYAAMDVFISTSSIDPHPLVVSEAMSAGCPAIISDKCGNWGYSDILQHRYNGLVYPCGDIDALSVAILKLSDTDTRKTYSQHAKEIASQQDLNAAVKAVMKVIEKIKTTK
jgi:glycosyltransferase involved in cell wall biosynthesis